MYGQTHSASVYGDRADRQTDTGNVCIVYTPTVNEWTLAVAALTLCACGSLHSIFFPGDRLWISEPLRASAGAFVGVVRDHEQVARRRSRPSRGGALSGGKGKRWSPWTMTLLPNIAQKDKEIEVVKQKWISDPGRSLNELYRGYLMVALLQIFVSKSVRCFWLRGKE